MNRYLWDGSYTVEAAFIVPMVLGILYAWMFHLFYLHDQVVMDGMLQELCSGRRMIGRTIRGRRSGGNRYKMIFGSLKLTE